VARYIDNASDLATNSPIQTTIIDFDQCGVNIHQLSENDELFENVDGENIKNVVSDPNIDPHLKLIMIFYLPLNQWDENIFDFVENCELTSKVSLLKLIILRANKDIDSEEQFSSFFNLLQKYDVQSQSKEQSFSMFPLTVSLCLETPEFIDTESDFYLIAQYM